VGEVDGGVSERLEQALGASLGMQAPFQYQEAPELLAGVRITAGAWVLHANVQDELADYARLVHDA
jgi:F-type H+-transporting ATPase subunit b